MTTLLPAGVYLIYNIIWQQLPTSLPVGTTPNLSGLVLPPPSVQTPQRSSIDISIQIGIDEAANKLRGDCANFVQKIIAIALPNATGGPMKPLPSIYSPANYALNEYIAAVQEGRVSPSGVTGATRDGDIIRTTYGKTLGNNLVVWNLEYYTLSPSEMGFHTLHEALHQIPGFSDEVIAAAARTISGRTDSIDDPSIYFNNRLREYCP
ncbi:MAG: hypothetical protein JST84_17460 [Acidobacteria bacterium]|nr:hypothetical protein [Acidobacteriota bacterium]